MLKIKPQQEATLAQQAAERFAARMRAHLARYFPRQTGLAGADAVDALIALGLERGAAHGMTTVATAQSYIDHMAMHGAFFDEDPLLARIRAPLDDADVGGPLARMDATHANSAAFLPAVNGPEGEHLFRALARLRAWTKAPDAFAIDGAAGVAALYERIHPERVAFFGRETTAQAALAAGAAGAAWGAASTPARVLYALLALVSGSGFPRDPLALGAAGEAGRALAAAPPGEARDAALFAVAAGILDRALEGARANGGA
ncbi:hypothetical protein [Rubrimonas cliftonensis]|uniref:Uncharacterized protein n=1 Tax=Rubrimonas cliftonensis TaxID=89524 RepID=A0A1H4DL10_9RHOB|nr:hypothetical protein [Rubrimonas cliftonensis]SEA72902.1 hypothetical protein SAMN05444370_11075 [Rubrimonas cliftonensis]